MVRTVPMTDSIRCALLLAGAALVTGCTTIKPTAPATAPTVTETSQTTPALEPGVPVMRYGRYALVEVGVTPSQRDLMEQIIDVTMPGADGTTVGDALRYVLRRSGYRLCNDSGPISALLRWPLPAADLHLGPITLRDALQTLAGDAWPLAVDDATRTVCFAPASDALHRPAAPVTTPDGPASNTAITPVSENSP
ncbi:PilL N-terminal domain-containing protein [Paraburkholderia agricolaris]|uniref:PilL N-terminal domain-containing protein n=1 Tax=Paraburkholderia agricolaris TaxID=2152888 RepID=A0ABW8ZJZ5_9BURK